MDMERTGNASTLQIRPGFRIQQAQDPPTGSIGIAAKRPARRRMVSCATPTRRCSGAKSAGPGRWHFFDPGECTPVPSTSSHAGEQEIVVGSTREFFAVYQPVVQLQDRRHRAMRPLSRWQHPPGPGPPADFLPVAEDSGLVVPLGQQVLEHVCCATLRARPPRSRWSISVNVSAVQWPPGTGRVACRHAGCLFGVKPADRLSRSRRPRSCPAVGQHRGVTCSSLRDLPGGGFTSTTSGPASPPSHLLRDLPVTGLKLDREFRPAPHQRRQPGQRSLGRGGGVGPRSASAGIAEGVGRRRQRWARCPGAGKYGQGYLFRPAPDHCPPLSGICAVVVARVVSQPRSDQDDRKADDHPLWSPAPRARTTPSIKGDRRVLRM